MKHTVFSEDLDFTLVDSNHLDADFLTQCFKDISQWIHDAAGIEMPVDLIRFDVYRNDRGWPAGQGRVGYRGPLQPGGDLPRIKLDLTTDEILVLEPATRNVHHPYSDCPETGIQSRCYCFEEVFAEKLRALAERERPRDLYDVVHLYRHDELTSNQAVILRALEEKCAFKGIMVPTMETFRNRPEREELEAEWQNMLAHQLPDLPPFDQFWAELPRVMAWLKGEEEKAAIEAIPTVGRIAIDESWQPPSMAKAWHVGVPLEKIRFAAANRLCVNLHYQGSVRLIEPYSLRRSQAGDLLLFAIKHTTSEPRSYRVDRIQGVEISKVPFVPKYAVELTPTGPIPAPALSRKPAIGSFAPEKRTTSIKFKSGPRYIIECPYCAKKFERTKRDSRLNPHKDKNGYPCHGRRGYLVEMKYQAL